VKKFVLVAAGKDQVGIVETLCKTLYEKNINLEDTSMVQLEDHFTVMMIIEAREIMDALTLKTVLINETRNYGLALDVFEVDVTQTEKPRTGSPWMLSVTSSDQTGIIYKVCKALAEKGINIYQLASRRMIQDLHSEKALFLMTLEVDVPENITGAKLIKDLQSLATESGFDIQAHPLETFVL